MDPISAISPPSVVDTVELGTSKRSGDFSSFLEQAIDRVQQAEQQRDQKVDAFLRGENEEVHEVLLSAQRAELSFEMFLQVRNKVVQAYQEVMRMQI